MHEAEVFLTAGASFSSEAASTQTIVLANTGNSSVAYNVSATPTGLFGGWITVAPTTGQSLPMIVSQHILWCVHMKAWLQACHKASWSWLLMHRSQHDQSVR